MVDELVVRTSVMITFHRVLDANEGFAYTSSFPIRDVEGGVVEPARHESVIFEPMNRRLESEPRIKR